MSIQDDAKAIVDELTRPLTFPTPWINLKQDVVASGLKARIDNPDSISSIQTSLCGPAEFFRDLATDKPALYARAAVQLYKFGIFAIGTLTLDPSTDLMNHALPANSRIHPADWLLLASLRDADNWWFDYQSESDDASAITMPHSKVKWLKEAGYSEIVNETNVIRSQDVSNALAASSAFMSGKKVALFINANMLEAPNSSSLTPDHWVALTSPILTFPSVNINNAGKPDPNTTVKLSVYSWGNVQAVPESGTLRLSNFLDNYYGYISARSDKAPTP